MHLHLNNSKKIVDALTPQGWAFFTRDPREAQVILYKIENNHIKKIPHLHSSAYNFLGLCRTSSIYMHEIQAIRTKLHNNWFSDTYWNYQSNIYGKFPTNSYSLYNDTKKPLLCGEYLLVFQKPVPWAWSSSIENIKMPGKIIRINIKCHD